MPAQLIVALAVAVLVVAFVALRSARGRAWARRSRDLPAPGEPVILSSPSPAEEAGAGPVWMPPTAPPPAEAGAGPVWMPPTAPPPAEAGAGPVWMPPTAPPPAEAGAGPVWIPPTAPPPAGGPSLPAEPPAAPQPSDWDAVEDAWSAPTGPTPPAAGAPPPAADDWGEPDRWSAPSGAVPAEGGWRPPPAPPGPGWEPPAAPPPHGEEPAWAPPPESGGRHPWEQAAGPPPPIAWREPVMPLLPRPDAGYDPALQPWEQVASPAEPEPAAGAESGWVVEESDAPVVEPVEPSEPVEPALEVESGPDAGETHVLAPGALRVGRAPDNEIVFRDPASSARHARIERRGDTFHIVDLGSTNGTLVNGDPVQERELAPGDVITIGQNRMRFRA